MKTHVELFLLHPKNDSDPQKNTLPPQIHIMRTPGDPRHLFLRANRWSADCQNSLSVPGGLDRNGADHALMTLIAHCDVGGKGPQVLWTKPKVKGCARLEE